MTRCIVGWQIVEERTLTTMQPVLDALHNADPKQSPGRQFFSDGLNVYPTLIYFEGTHTPLQNKSQTYSVEGSNAEIRHYLGRLHRRSRCFCRRLDSLRRAFWLFVYCYNRRALLWHRHPKLRKANMGLAQFLTAIN